MSDASPRKRTAGQELFNAFAGLLLVPLFLFGRTTLGVVVGVALIVGVVMQALTSGRSRRMVPAAAMQAGLALVPLLAGLLVLGGNTGLRPLFAEDHLRRILIEYALFAAGAFALVVWPSLFLITLLTVYHGLTVPFYVAWLFDGQLPERMASACFTHVGIRTLAVIYMYRAYLYRPDASPAAAAPAGAYPAGAFVGSDWAKRVWDDSLARARRADPEAAGEPEEPARRSGWVLTFSVVLGLLATAGGATTANLLARDGQLREVMTGVPAKDQADRGNTDPSAQYEALFKRYREQEERRNPPRAARRTTGAGR